MQRGFTREPIPEGKGTQARSPRSCNLLEKDGIFKWMVEDILEARVPPLAS